MSKQAIDPSVNLLEEISEQSSNDMSGAGQIWTYTLYTCSTCYAVSWALGNNGKICTATVECMGNCGKEFVDLTGASRTPQWGAPVR